MDDTVKLMQAIPWGEHYLATPTNSVEWRLTENERERVYTALSVSGIQVKIDHATEPWRTIVRVAEGYQRAGMLCENDPKLLQKYLDYQYLSIVRCYGRLENLISQEATWRDSPKFWSHFVFLGKEARERYQQLSRKRTSQSGTAVTNN